MSGPTPSPERSAAQQRFFGELRRPLREQAPDRPYVSYLDQVDVNWSAELEELHDDASGDHFIDVWTRRAALAALSAGRLGAEPVLVDLGCSVGAFLRDLARAWPAALIVGVDAVPTGLRRAHTAVPEAALLEASVTELPFGEGTVDGLVALNVLEHVPDDVRALEEARRVLRPGGRAVVVVPANPSLYDHYDELLRHERRYARGELRRKLGAAGLHPLSSVYLGSLIYPPFWLVKKYGRLRHPTVSESRSRELVEGRIRATRGSRLGALSCALEGRLAELGLRLPFGIRELAVAERP